MNDSEKNKKSKDNKKEKYALFDLTLSDSRKRNIKMYIDYAKKRAKITNKVERITIDGKSIIIYPNGHIYLDKNLDNFKDL